MNQRSNPYAPSEELDSQHSVIDFTEVVRRWERWRVWYNAIVAVLVLGVIALTFPTSLLTLRFWMLCLVGTIFANLQFLLGPTAEGYTRTLGIWSPIVSYLIFWLGVGMTSILGTICLLKTLS